MKVDVTIATQVEEQVSEIMKSRGSFDTLRAELYGLTFDTNGGVSVELITSNGDVYELIDSAIENKSTEGLDGIAVLTCGWAAPLPKGETDDDDDDHVPPSQHPERRRVRLVICANREGVASVLRFQDTPNEITTDEGSAKGSLADAILALVS
jgi:hypothetical protein